MMDSFSTFINEEKFDVGKYDHGIVEILLSCKDADIMYIEKLWSSYVILDKKHKKVLGRFYDDDTDISPEKAIRLIQKTIHPSVSFINSIHINIKMGTKIGKNTILTGRVNIEDIAEIGNNCVIHGSAKKNMETTIEHKAVISDNVRIERGVIIAVNVHIGKNCSIGDDAEILYDLPPHTIIPANTIISNKKHIERFSVT